MLVNNEAKNKTVSTKSEHMTYLEHHTVKYFLRSGKTRKVIFEQMSTYMMNLDMQVSKIGSVKSNTSESREKKSTTIDGQHNAVLLI